MNAIILAAGLGSRMSPYTEHIPKPLTEIEGLPLIERQIKCIKGTGINDIHIVVGYKSDMFLYLKGKYNVNLVYNSLYAEYNNIYSLFLCKGVLADTWIIEGDIFFRRNFLSGSIKVATYLSVFKTRLATEWVLEFSERGKLSKIVTQEDCDFDVHYPSGAYIMSGVSFWNRKSSNIIRHCLDEFGNLINKSKRQPMGENYWDQIIKNNLSRFNITVQKIDHKDCFEIDTLNDLNDLLLTQ